MPFTAAAFGRKLSTLRKDFGQEIGSVASSTGIPPDRLGALEDGRIEPTGDEVLILADHYRKDFQYLLADGAEDPDEGVELLFRERGDVLPQADRVAIAEFAFLCRSEAMLERELRLEPRGRAFEFRPRGKFMKGHGHDCAAALRKHLNLNDREGVRDLFSTIRDMGIRVFRRRLENSNISGLFMNHPEAGRCILVNLAEGLARQRFSAAHELGHAILDADDAPITLSMVAGGSNPEWVEVRANAFASHFLIPPGLLAVMPRDHMADPAGVSALAERLRVSVPALLSGLLDARIISAEQRSWLREVAQRPPEPPDPELEGQLSPAQLARKQALLERGLSGRYVGLAFEAFNARRVSLGLLTELLLSTPGETVEIAALFGRSLGRD
ncbi:ImmA/IrrE family metallo-endopeptidase [Roseomonas sp. 18066]|uniref:helix-turn-helix domain-containing protein n=1 Tax=Roseomonas sp. 18066 TaxID=2681412 RepID=UPI0013595AB9|nr:XRE family transcriptional regulator [Roseomonas sp. 18066]